MPDGYTGLNFGSYNLSELVGVYFPTVTQSYFTSLDVDDIWEQIQPVDTIFTSVDAVVAVYTPIEATETTYTNVF
tara:strand:- start:3217 stop:3441 length:225 start_codon:yes stop_codon:yes gene_type:complete